MGLESVFIVSGLTDLQVGRERNLVATSVLAKLLQLRNLGGQER